jgi:hypothetical protein
MLKTLALERISRRPLRLADAAVDGEICLDRIGREGLEPGEKDE